VVTQTLHPNDIGFDLARPEDLLGGSAVENAKITRGILDGSDSSPRRDVVLLNAAAALVVGGKADTLEAGIQQAAQSIDNGAAMQVLEKLVSFTQTFAA
jgi:anthranilate phosphoribosyltransferase